jgi:hypothetical protein
MLASLPVHLLEEFEKKKKKKPFLAMNDRYSLFRREFWRRGATPAALVY